jgi:hypothetical protein
MEIHADEVAKFDELFGMTATAPFDASRGGLYFCFGWFSVSGFVAGLAACNVDIAAIMNPLRVCTTP